MLKLCWNSFRAFWAVSYGRFLKLLPKSGSEKVFENTESGSKLMLAADSGHDPWTLPTQSASSPPPSPPPHTSSPPPTSTSTSLRKIRTWSQILKPVGNEESRVSQTVPKDAVSGDSLPFLCCQNVQPPDPAALNVDQFPHCQRQSPCPSPTRQQPTMGNLSGFQTASLKKLVVKHQELSGSLDSARFLQSRKLLLFHSHAAIFPMVIFISKWIGL